MIQISARSFVATALSSVVLMALITPGFALTKDNVSDYKGWTK